MQNNEHSSQRASDTDDDWATKIKTFVKDWDDEGGRKPLVHRNNFERFVATKTISDWDGWQACLKRHFQDRTWIFRGHKIATWLLVPSLERVTLKTISLGGNSNISGLCRVMPDYSEKHLLLEFQRRAHVYFPDVPRDDQTVE
jgi:hypothetical protein